MQQLDKSVPSFTLPDRSSGPEARNLRTLEGAGTRLKDILITALNALIGGGTIDASAAWDTGRTWTDGSAIKAKYVSLGALPNATTTNDAHGVTLGTIVGLYGGATASGTFVPLPNDGILLSADATNIIVTTTTDWSSYTGWAVLEYVE